MTLDIIGHTEDKEPVFNHHQHAKNKKLSPDGHAFAAGWHHGMGEKHSLDTRDHRAAEHELDHSHKRFAYHNSQRDSHVGSYDADAPSPRGHRGVWGSYEFKRGRKASVLAYRKYYGI